MKKIIFLLCICSFQVFSQTNLSQKFGKSYWKLEGNTLKPINPTWSIPSGSGSSDSIDAGDIITGTLNDARLSSNVTLQGNSFGGANQLLKLDGSGFIPALNGSQITGITQSQVSGLATSLGTKWGITGNSGTVDGTNFIGTTDNIAFNIRVNNQKAGRIDRSGGLNNNFFGYTAGNSISTGSKNNAFGTEALYSDTSGSQNIAFGYKALFTNSNASHNLAIGSEALLNSNADKNIAIGNLSLQANTSGTENFGLGYASIINNQTGDYNTAVGNFSLSGNQSGNSNTAIGHTALSGNTTGSENTAIGYQADVLGSNLTNATAIGANATVGVSNGFVLGNSATLVGIGTSTPAYKLDVNGTGRFIDIIVDSIVNDNDLKIRGVNSTTIETTTGDILFKAPGSGFDFQGADYFQTQTYSTSFQNTGTFSVTASDVTITANNTSVSGGISIDTLTLNGRTLVYSTTSGINAKNTGTTNLYTVPTGKTFSVREATIYVTSASAITNTPTLGIGIVSGEDDIYFPTQLVGLDATNEMYRFSTGGTYRVGQAGDVVKLGIDTGATATTMTIKVVLIGDLE